MSVQITREQQLPPFVNEPLTDFSLPENRSAFEAALKQARAQFGKEYLCCVDGEWVKGSQTFNSVNPSNLSEVIGVIQKGDVALAERAQQVALRAYESWSRTPAPERVAYFLRAHEILRKRRHEMSAWMVLEAGKTREEADGDTAEAIDFLNYYSRQMLRLDNPAPLPQFPGEEDRLAYIPLGVGVVIPPWNFPCAILAGMTVAAAVAGNTVVVKPSVCSSVIGLQFMKILEEAGLPRGVVNMVTGSGSVLGDYLVKHPKTRFIAFTGSMEVGCSLNVEAAKVAPGQIWLKRVVAEMGGKNATIVCDDADLDSAAQGVVTAAFGYQGQKCSASSRAVVMAPVYDAFVEKVGAAVRALKVAPAEQGGADMGPVISKSAYTSILEYIEIGKNEARLIAGGEKAPGNGYFIQPTVFADVKPDARIAQEEIFGPVLAIIKAGDFDDALRIANGTRFGLTGAVYSKDAGRLDQAVREFHVGNLYLNRKCTGALVGCHPFGGFNMSGTDSKAGGPDYLLQFTQAKSVARKL